MDSTGNRFILDLALNITVTDPAALGDAGAQLAEGTFNGEPELSVVNVTDVERVRHVVGVHLAMIADGPGFKITGWSDSSRPQTAPPS